VCRSYPVRSRRFKTRTSNLIPFLACDLFVGFLKSERLGAGPRTLLESDHDPFAFYRLPKCAAVLESIFLSLAASVGGFFPSPWFPCGACNFEGSVSCFCEFIYCSVQLLWCFLIVPWGGYSSELLYTCASRRLALAKLTGKGESRDNTVSMNLWSEMECSSETAQFLTAFTSESDTNVRSMIVWQVLVKGTTLLLLH